MHKNCDKKCQKVFDNLKMSKTTTTKKTTPPPQDFFARSCRNSENISSKILCFTI